MAAHLQSDDADLATHAASYHRFMLVLKWFAIHAATLLAFLTLWLATSAGFFAALVIGAAIFAAGAYAMAHGLAHSSESDNDQGGGNPSHPEP